MFALRSKLDRTGQHSGWIVLGDPPPWIGVLMRHHGVHPDQWMHEDHRRKFETEVLQPKVQRLRLKRPSAKIIPFRLAA